MNKHKRDLYSELYEIIIKQHKIEDISELINQISDNSHYIKKSFSLNITYHLQCINRLKILTQHLTKTEVISFLKKLHFFDKFNEKQFIQYASELTVISHFLEYYPNDFLYEPRLNSIHDKNPECQIKIDNFKFNIEVKCPEYTNQEAVLSKDGIKIGIYGRHPEKDKILNEMSGIVKEGSLKAEGKEVEVHNQKHLGLNILSYLKEAHMKFPENPINNEINVLFIGSNEKMDEICGLFYGHEGLFTNQSFTDPNEYNKIDIIVLSNLYYSHKNYCEKEYLRPFELNKLYNVYYVNPKRQLDKKEGIVKFHTLYHNYNAELIEFAKQYNEPDPTGANEMNKLFIFSLFNEYYLKPKGIKVT